MNQCAFWPINMEGRNDVLWVVLSRVNDKASKGSEVHLRAFCCKAPGGGGRLRQATAREEKKRREEAREEAREEDKRREDISN